MPENAPNIASLRQCEGCALFFRLTNQSCFGRMLGTQRAPFQPEESMRPVGPWCSHSLRPLAGVRATVTADIPNALTRGIPSWVILVLCLKRSLKLNAVRTLTGSSMRSMGLRASRNLEYVRIPGLRIAAWKRNTAVLLGEIT